MSPGVRVMRLIQSQIPNGPKLRKIQGTQVPSPLFVGKLTPHCGCVALFTLYATDISGSRLLSNLIGMSVKILGGKMMQGKLVTSRCLRYSRPYGSINMVGLESCLQALSLSMLCGCG